VGVDHPLADQAEAYALGALTPAERAAFEAHLAVCPACAREVRELTSVAAALGRLGVDAAPDAAVRQRILTAIRHDATIGTVVSRDTARSSGSRLAWLAMAAAIVAAIGAALYANDLRGRIETLEARLRDAIVRAEVSERRVADLQRRADTSASMLAVVLAPDAARVELAGQTAAPSASARAYWSRARGLVIHASNLPPLPPGRTYQLWVLTAQPAPISAGLLRPDTSGGASAVFNTPPDIPTPTAMAVTLEPEGGVPSPTGDKYLVGVAH
jgi:anti-sigma-K factor RskA